MMRFLATAGFMLAVLSVPEMAFAIRTMQAPRFAWHDWAHVSNWCASNSSAAHFKSLEISISNISDINQSVTVRCQGDGISGNGDPPGVLTVRSMITGQGENSANAVLSVNVNIGPKSSTGVTCNALYRGPQPTAGSPGYYHLQGALDVSFEVAEDRGAITAVMNSSMEDNGCLTYAAGDPVSLFVSTIRNIPRTLLVNGGRPF